MSKHPVAYLEVGRAQCIKKNKAGFSVFDKGDCLPRPGSYGDHLQQDFFVLLVSLHSALRVNFNHLFGISDHLARAVSNSSRTVEIKEAFLKKLTMFNFCGLKSNCDNTRNFRVAIYAINATQHCF